MALPIRHQDQFKYIFMVIKSGRTNQNISMTILVHNLNGILVNTHIKVNVETVLGGFSLVKGRLHVVHTKEIGATTKSINPALGCRKIVCVLKRRRKRNTVRCSLRRWKGLKKAALHYFCLSLASIERIFSRLGLLPISFDCRLAIRRR